METRVLIPANTSVHNRANKLIRFTDTSKLRTSKITPPCHSIVSKTDGSVTLTEYDSRAEYCKHRNSVFAAVAKYHAETGKQPLCMCLTCSGKRRVR